MPQEQSWLKRWCSVSSSLLCYEQRRFWPYEVPLLLIDGCIKSVTASFTNGTSHHESHYFTISPTGHLSLSLYLSFIHLLSSCYSLCSSFTVFPTTSQRFTLKCSKRRSCHALFEMEAVMHGVSECAAWLEMLIPRIWSEGLWGNNSSHRWWAHFHQQSITALFWQLRAGDYSTPHNQHL